MEIKTPRLVLREYSELDFEAVHSYASDEDVTRYMSFGPNSKEYTQAFLSKMVELANRTPRTDYHFAIELLSTGKLIGGCGLVTHNEINKDAEIGYVLHPDYHRQGYAPEASQALIQYAFKTLGLHRIYAYHHPENPKSGRVMQKLGMQYEGLMRKSHWIKDSWWDFHVYAILEDDPIPPWETN